MTDSPSTTYSETHHRLEQLGHYTGEDGRRRELIACRAAAGSVLVVDRCVDTLEDRRLVAHLGGDEPKINAALTCERYLQDPSRGRCRRMVPCDLTNDPCAVLRSPLRSPVSVHADRRPASSPELTNPRDKSLYRLALEPEKTVSELRWCRYPSQDGGSARPLSLREVVGALEGYEPACESTQIALTHHADDTRVSLSTLRSELVRLRESPIVLNRGLREAVRRAIEMQGLSMSEIALRCGRVKRDAKGNRSGETSWLARRLGLVAESGADRPTPWIHTDVLALIARSGLGISPREVELH